MEPWSYELAGRLDEHAVESEVLKDNALGDPHVRPLWVYVPPGYDDSDGRYPSIYVIQGLTGQIDMWRNRTAFRQNFPELADAAIANGECPPCVLVYLDAWTSVGGSQFVDSPGTGRYHTYICDELVPFVDERYRTLAGAEHRGIAGKSSGGYGAMVNPMLRPDVFGGLATHAGDALFEMCYLPEFRNSVRTLRDRYEGSFDRFWEDFRSRPAFSKDTDHALLNDWCMAACYSADEDGTVQLPYDTDTGELRPEIWERWLAGDPVRLARGGGRAGHLEADAWAAARARLPSGDDAYGPDDPSRRRRRQRRARQVLQPAACGTDGAHPRRRLARPLAARDLDFGARLAQGLD